VRFAPIDYSAGMQENGLRDQFNALSLHYVAAQRVITIVGILLDDGVPISTRNDGLWREVLMAPCNRKRHPESPELREYKRMINVLFESTKFVLARYRDEFQVDADYGHNHMLGEQRKDAKELAKIAVERLREFFFLHEGRTDFLPPAVEAMIPPYGTVGRKQKNHWVILAAELTRLSRDYALGRWDIESLRRPEARAELVSSVDIIDQPHLQRALNGARSIFQAHAGPTLEIVTEPFGPQMQPLTEHR
jgi:hypothetical protein